jgi:hypothetical protein
MQGIACEIVDDTCNTERDKVSGAGAMDTLEWDITSMTPWASTTKLPVAQMMNVMVVVVVMVMVIGMVMVMMMVTIMNNRAW